VEVFDIAKSTVCNRRAFC